MVLSYTFIIFVFYLFVFLFGICIGSFLNVCIYRIPLHISVAKGRSFCPSCSHSLNAWDLFPVLGFLFLKGRCRYCSSNISLRYPAVELLTGFLYVWAFYIYGFQIFSAVLSLFFSILIVIGFIDFDKGIIPDRLVISILVLTPFFVWFSPFKYSFTEHIAGIFLVSVPMFLLALFLGGFGGGDIKLMAACGLLLGARLITVSIVLAILSGALYSIILMALKKADRKSAIPFGPFLSVGMICAALFGNHIIHWYLTLYQ